MIGDVFIVIRKEWKEMLLQPSLTPQERYGRGLIVAAIAGLLLAEADLFATIRLKRWMKGDAVVFPHGHCCRLFAGSANVNVSRLFASRCRTIPFFLGTAGSYWFGEPLLSWCSGLSLAWRFFSRTTCAWSILAMLGASQFISCLQCSCEFRRRCRSPCE